MCISIQHLSYLHPDKEILISDISFSVMQGQKVALIGNNGSGKSTLLQIISGILPLSSGEIICSSKPYYIPQHFGQYNDLSIAQALQVDAKVDALQAIINGDASELNFSILADDWEIEKRTTEALLSWGLDYLELSQQLSTLSGGEKTNVFLAGIEIHSPHIILLDEPTNHLDYKSREKLYEFIESSRATIVVVSHDRTLLNLLPSTFELNKEGVKYYAGNYEFYKIQKEQEISSLTALLDEKDKELRLARKIAREAIERKQKHEVRGEKHNAKKGISKMAMDKMKDKAEKSSSKLKNVHTDKFNSISDDISELQTKLPDCKLMKTNFNDSVLHTGKILITAKDINFRYGSIALWSSQLNFQIKNGERILIRGTNGAGKTTLLKLITRLLEVSEGLLTMADFSSVFLDQEYSIINNQLSVFEQVQQYADGLQDHEIKIILNRFLFSFGTWDKPCIRLSGGEKMKLSLCCLMVSANAPDLFILDEPTNNIDIQNVDILISTMKDYKGTILVVSHDKYFIDQIDINYSINLF